ncbi:MAG: hypothetical protein MR821_08285 [Clostridiales bacterium]|nr:hypothetical protein [Clostridiales bacterium]
MRKRIALLLAVTAMLIAAAVSADVIKPMPSAIDARSVANQAVYVKLLDIDWRAETVTVTLCDEATFDREAIQAMTVGDTIVIDGMEIEVRSIWEDMSYIIVNKDGEALALWENDDGIYESAYGYTDMRVWTVVGERTFELPDDLVFLDGINPSTGEPLELPTAHTLRELRQIMEGEEYDPGFSAQNAYMVFDDEQEPVLLVRFYVPWQ